MLLLNTALQIKRWNFPSCFLFLSKISISPVFILVSEEQAKQLIIVLPTVPYGDLQVSQLNYSSCYFSWSRLRVHSFTDFFSCLNVEWHQIIPFFLVFLHALCQGQKPTNIYPNTSLLLYYLKDFKKTSSSIFKNFMSLKKQQKHHQILSPHHCLFSVFHN